MICPTRLATNFSHRDWTGQIAMNPLEKIAFLRTDIAERLAAETRAPAASWIALATAAAIPLRDTRGLHRRRHRIDLIGENHVQLRNAPLHEFAKMPEQGCSELRDR
jgi:hypothetical protein